MFEKWEAEDEDAEFKRVRVTEYAPLLKAQPRAQPQRAIHSLPEPIQKRIGKRAAWEEAPIDPNDEVLPFEDKQISFKRAYGST